MDDSTDDGSDGQEDSWGDVDWDLEIDDNGNEPVCSEPGPYDSAGVTDSTVSVRAGGRRVSKLSRTGHGWCLPAWSFLVVSVQCTVCTVLFL